MAQTFINSASGSGLTISTIGVAYPAPTTAGNYLVAHLAFTAAPGTFVTKPAWATQRGATHNNGNIWHAIFEGPNSGSQSGTQTFVWTNAAIALLAIGECTGTASSPNDGTDQTATGTSASVAGGAVTTTNANDMVLGFLAQESTAGAITYSSPLPSPATIGIQAARFDNVIAHNGIGIAIIVDVVSSTGTYTPSATSNRSANWSGVSYAIKATGGAITVVQRKTLTALGTRVGTRQVRN